MDAATARHALDWAAIGAYLLATVLIAAAATRRRTTASELFLAGRSLGPLAAVFVLGLARKRLGPRAALFLGERAGWVPTHFTIIGGVPFVPTQMFTWVWAALVALAIAAMLWVFR